MGKIVSLPYIVNIKNNFPPRTNTESLCACVCAYFILDGDDTDQATTDIVLETPPSKESKDAEVPPGHTHTQPRI